MIINAILKINPNAKVTVTGDKIEWHEDTTPIFKADIEAMIPVVEAEMAQAELDRETKKQEAEAIMEQLGLTKEHLKALGL